MEASIPADGTTPTTESQTSPSRADWFVADAFVLSAEIGRNTFPVMVDAAEQFLWSGLTWERWSMLSEQSRAAFVDAGMNIAKQKVAWMAELLSSRVQVEG